MLTFIFAAIDPVVGIIGAGSIAAIGAYLAAVRKMSGKVGSSDAEQLWNESRDMRKVLIDQAREQGILIGALQARVGIVEAQNIDLGRENKTLVEQVHDLNSLVVDLRGEIGVLVQELQLSRSKVAELQYDVDNPPKRRSTDITTEGGTHERT